jgi:hypothetical protein
MNWKYLAVAAGLAASSMTAAALAADRSANGMFGGAGAARSGGGGGTLFSPRGSSGSGAVPRIAAVPRGNNFGSSAPRRFEGGPRLSDRGPRIDRAPRVASGRGLFDVRPQPDRDWRNRHVDRDGDHDRPRRHHQRYYANNWYGYGYGYGYGPSVTYSYSSWSLCDRYYQRWLDTGSYYWRDRYEDCIS